MELITETSYKSITKSNKVTLQRLLFCLLKIISASHESQAISACGKLLSFLKKNNAMFDAFRPNKQLLTQMNFGRLLNIPEDSVFKENVDTKQVVFDVMTFVLRYYSDVSYEDFGLDDFNLEGLKKEEVKRIWMALEKMIHRHDEMKKNFKNRNVRFSILIFLEIDCECSWRDFELC